MWNLHQCGLPLCWKVTVHQWNQQDTFNIVMLSHFMLQKRKLADHRSPLMLATAVTTVCLAVRHMPNLHC